MGEGRHPDHLQHRGGRQGQHRRAGHRERHAVGAWHRADRRAGLRPRGRAACGLQRQGHEGPDHREARSAGVAGAGRSIDGEPRARIGEREQGAGRGRGCGSPAQAPEDPAGAAARRRCHGRERRGRLRHGTRGTPRHESVIGAGPGEPRAGEAQSLVRDHLLARRWRRAVARRGRRPDCRRVALGADVVHHCRGPRPHADRHRGCRGRRRPADRGHECAVHRGCVPRQAVRGHRAPGPQRADHHERRRDV